MNGEALQQCLYLTFPVLGFQDQGQLAGGHFTGHLCGTHGQSVMAGHVQRRVSVPVLQLDADAFGHETLDDVGQVQVGGQMQRTLQKQVINRINPQLKLAAV